MDCENHRRFQLDAELRQDRYQSLAEGIELRLGLPDVEHIDVAVSLEGDVERASVGCSGSGRLKPAERICVLLRGESAMLEIDSERHLYQPFVALDGGCCVKGAGGRVGVDGAGCARRSPVGSGAGFSVFQMAVAASLCLWSFSRLWVAVIRRHSERAADLPRRWKRSIRRLNFVFAKTGSIIDLRFA